MSQWTHVFVVAEVEGYDARSRQELGDQITQRIRGMEISGSEGPADVYVNVASNPGTWHLKLGGTIYYWNRAYIIWAGHLRDRDKKTTQGEVDNLLARLKREFSVVRNFTSQIYEDGEELDYYAGDGAVDKKNEP